MKKFLFLLLFAESLLAQEARFYPFLYLSRLNEEAKVSRMKRVFLYIGGGTVGCVYGIKEEKEGITALSALLFGAGVWYLLFKSQAERDFLRISHIEDEKEREEAAALSLVILSHNARKRRMLEALGCGGGAIVCALEGEIKFCIPLLFTSIYHFFIKSEEEEVYSMYLKKEEKKDRRRY